MPRANPSTPRNRKRKKQDEERWNLPSAVISRRLHVDQSFYLYLSFVLLVDHQLLESKVWKQTSGPSSDSLVFYLLNVEISIILLFPKPLMLRELFHKAFAFFYFVFVFNVFWLLILLFSFSLA